MSTGGKKVFGDGLIKAKKLKRLSNFTKNKQSNGTAATSVCATSSVDSVPNVTASPIQLGAQSGEGSPFLGFSPSAVKSEPFLGFSPQPDFVPLRRKPPSNVSSVPNVNASRIQVGAQSGEGSPFLGFSPPVVKSEPFLGFSPQSGFVPFRCKPPTNSIASLWRKTVCWDKSPNVCDVLPSTPVRFVPLQRRCTSISQPLNTLPVQNRAPIQYKRHSADCDVHPIYGTDLPMTPLLSKRQSVLSEEIVPPYEPQPFFKIVLGDFCQFSRQFKLPHSQCSAMATAALAYSIIKPIDTWVSGDLNNVLFTGQKYYEECLLNLELDSQAQVHEAGFLEPGELNENFFMDSRRVEVHNDFLNCRGGPHDSIENITGGLRHFADNDITHIVLTYNDRTYALLHFSNMSSSCYVFFDSHGREEDGKRSDRDVRDGKAALLFFHNVNDFIHFFLQEHPLLAPSANFALHRNLQFTPMIIFVTDINSPSNPPVVHSRETSGHIGSENEASFIACGNFCEHAINSSIYGRHQCLGIVIFSFLYSTLHSVMTWGAGDLDEILNFGTLYFEECFKSESVNNSQFISVETMHPRQLSGCVAYKTVAYKVDVSELDFSGRMGKEYLLDGLKHLENLDIPFGILAINELSFGLIVCGTWYIFFDSHGRPDNGSPNGSHSAVFYFDNIVAIVDFLFRKFCAYGGFDIHPVQFSEAPQISPVLSENVFVNPPLCVGSAEGHHGGFEKMVCATGIISETLFDKHSHSIAISITAICNTLEVALEDWVENTLQMISDNAILYHSACNESAIEKRKQIPLSTIDNFILEFGVNDSDYKLLIVNREIGPPRFSVTFSRFERAFRFFYSSAVYYYAILTVANRAYAICKYGASTRLMFYDAHGRNSDGIRGGNLSVAIYFETSVAFISFLRNEIEETELFSLEYIEFEYVDNIAENVPIANLYTHLISGTFAQNDARFCEQSRGTQCSGNSVVFLAFAFLLQDDWASSDVDAILELGDHIYMASYQEAIRLRPRTHTFLAASEVKENIFVHISRLDRGVVNVRCKPLADKEMSGIFGRDGRNRIELFFKHFTYGVFICCSLSVALFKQGSVYVLFDPHERTNDGKLNVGGVANIFFFLNVASLFQFLCECSGYNQLREFTLTPFDVTELVPNKPGTVPAPTHRPMVILEVSGDSFDDIPIPESGEWNGSEDIPVSVLKEKLKPKNERDRDDKRRKRKYERRKRNILLKSQEAQDIHRRWTNYYQNCRQMRESMVFDNAEEYTNFYLGHRGDGSDEELAAAAQIAVDEFTRVENTRQLRMQNNETHERHFQAFGNHEDIDETEERYNLYKLSPMDRQCPHCGAFYFKEECNSRNIFRTCCNFGQVHSELPEKLATTYPPFLKDLLLHQSPLSKHFMDNIMLYNNVLSFASLGTTNVHYMQARGSLGPVIAMEGMIYHIAEHFHTNSTGANMPTAQLYYIDTSRAVAERQLRAGQPLNVGLLLRLENFMRAHNPLAGAYRMLKEVLDEVNRRPNVVTSNINLQIVRNRDQIRIRQNHGGDFAVPTSNEVAAIYTHLPSAATKNVVVFPVDRAPEHGIALASHDPNRDAMLYPILFPHSEQTWTYNLFRKTNEEIDQEQHPAQNDADESEPEEEDASVAQGEPEDDVRESRRRKPRKRITVREFFCFMLMIRTAFSPLLNAGKLGQQFIIDAYARAQDNAFEYLQSEKGQAQIRSETYGALKDFLDRKKVFQPDLPGKIIVMPNDIVGSRQYMKKRYADALAMVAKYGKPTFFITMTCNPMWEEIQTRIPKGSNPVDRPEVVARVFKAKVTELINDISKRDVMGKCVAYLAVIEWQKRSLPHCHLVTFNAREDQPASHVDIDGFVSAEIPDPEKTSTLYDYVTTYMYHHRCDDMSRNETCRVPRKGNFVCPRHPPSGGQGDLTKSCVCYECSKHFPRQFSSKSELIEGSYPVYRRRKNGRSFISSRQQEITNQWIVPYNPQLLLKYNCHINVEITSSLKSIKYLFKYLHKGLDMARLNIQIVDNVQVYNEFQHFVDCRYLSAGEAVWKLFDFPMFYQSHTVYALPVHLENYQNIIFRSDDPAAALTHADSHLTAYFQLNQTDENAKQYLYAEIPLHYVFHKKEKKWKPRKRRAALTLSRLYTVDYNRIELYSLRLLLLTVRGALSYEHLRTVAGIQYGTFREAACALGLLDDDTLNIQTFEEIVDVEMPYRIRCLFVNMLVFNTPSDPVVIWDLFKKKMFEDYVRKGCSEEVAENLALKHISRLLFANGKTNSDYLLPEPTSVADSPQVFPSGDLDDDTLITLADEAVEGQRLVELLNTEQRCIFDEIVDSVRHPNDTTKKRLFFVDGPGGTGKTFLFSTLISVLHGMGEKVLPIAWTGIAASLLKGGRTAHSAFKLPFDISGPVGCHLSTYSDSANDLRDVAVIVWDEVSMTISYALDAVDSFFQDLMGNNLPFGGKIFIATGDFRQILPVVKGGSKYDVLNVVAKRCNVWPLLEKRSLKTNVRLTDPSDIAFAQFLLDVGEGKQNDFPENEYYNSYVKIPAECIEPNSILDRIYGSTFSSATVDEYSKYCIMTTLNEDVDFLNDEIYKRMTEETSTEQIYYSNDSVVGFHPNDDDAYDVSMLNTLRPPNLPPHVLKLKVNCIVMLLLNLAPSRGLCNGTRLIVTKLYKNSIRCKILSGNFKGDEVLLSRCRLTTDSIDVSCKFQRIQIPVKLSFVMTINRGQGQTFEYAGVYLRKPPFAHGHLYVALSRARSKDKLIVQVLPSPLMGKLNPGSTDVFVPNIVYKEVFR